MKNIILLLFALAIFNTACKKCMTCETTTFIQSMKPAAGYPKSSTTESKYCDEDLKIAEGQRVTEEIKGGLYLRTTVTTKCH